MDEEPAGLPSSSSAPLTPRQLRVRRRHRRRIVGTALFVAMAIGVFLTAYFTVAGGDDSSDQTTGTSFSNASTTAPAPTPTTAAKIWGPYKVTDGVNVRQGPGTSTPVVGTIETGHVVFVVCVAEGEPVNGPAGPNNRWVRITGFGPIGYVTAVYVDAGADLRSNAIPVCSTR